MSVTSLRTMSGERKQHGNASNSSRGFFHASAAGRSRRRGRNIGHRFLLGGWVTGGTAKEMVQRSTSTAVVTALSPICVDKFQHSSGAAANMVELKKVSSYQQGRSSRKAAGRRSPATTAPTPPWRAYAPRCSAT